MNELPEFILTFVQFHNIIFNSFCYRGTFFMICLKCIYYLGKNWNYNCSLFMFFQTIIRAYLAIPSILSRYCISYTGNIMKYGTNIFEKSEGTGQSISSLGKVLIEILQVKARWRKPTKCDAFPAKFQSELFRIEDMLWPVPFFIIYPAF